MRKNPDSAMPGRASRAEGRRVVLPLFVLLALTYGYGHQEFANPNAVSRMALTLAIVAEQRLSIEPFQDATEDKAFHDGRYYSDKAPGLSLAAVPAAYAGWLATGRGGADTFVVRAPSADPAYQPLAVTLRFALLLYLATAVVCGGATALAACAVYLAARRLGQDPPAALFAALAFALATPAWGWATAFFGHALAGAALFAAFALALDRAERGASAWGAWAGVGLLLGIGILTEYPVVVPAALICALACAETRRRGRRLGPVLVGLAAGAFPCALALAAYERAVTGGWLQVGYGQVVGFSGMQAGFLGLTYPRPIALYGILLSARRGLVWVAPICLAVPLAFRAARRGGMPATSWAAALAIVVYFVLFNASYAYWDGGWSTGPRHLTAALPFAALPLAWAWSRARPAGRAALAALAAASAAVAFGCAAVEMFMPSDVENPLLDVILPGLLRGELKNALELAATIGAIDARPGWWTAVPLAALWVAGGAYLTWAIRGARVVGAR